MLPQAIEIKAKSVIAQIENGTFCEDDIELLLIRLREYSSPKSIFREISHFIAHHKRDSGLTFLSLYQLYCRMRAYNEFQYLKKSLDLSATFEKWFYDFVLFQLDEIDSQKLKKKYGFSRKRAKQIFKSSFDEAKDGYTCKSAPDHELVNIVNEASSFIKVKPLFNNSEIISSFVETLLALNLISTSEKIEAHSDEIIVCLLLLDIFPKYSS
ncbi:MAG: hypothetical protein WC856_25300 [Methylococcaceae bacterium]